MIIVNSKELIAIPTIQQFFGIKEGQEISEATAIFLDAMVEKKYAPDENIVEIDCEPDDGMYIIIEGNADVYNRDGIVINRLGRGDFIGELALINDDKRAARVKAAGEVVCANISKQLFEDIAFKNRKIYGIFLNMLYNKTKTLMYNSEHDQLTGLYNKGKYLEMVAGDYKNMNSIGLFNFDVNNLKKINDTMGHEAGDKLIIKAADSIRKVTTTNVHGYRMGGDEFLMVACNVTEEEVEVIKARWEEELARLNTLDDGIDCVIAVGVVYGEAPYDFGALNAKADSLMYEDKKRKKKPGEEIR